MERDTDNPTALVPYDDSEAKRAGELVAAMKERVVGFVVETAQHHADGSEFLIDLQTKSKEWDDTRKEEKAPYLDAGRVVDKSWFGSIEALTNAKVDLARKLGQYEDQVEQETREREARERQAILEQERKERERLEKEAKRFEKKGDEEAAEQMRDAAQTVEAAPPPVAPQSQPFVPKTKGASSKKVWSAVVRPEQPKLLAKAIAKWNADCDDGREILPAAYWRPNHEALDAFAKKTEGGVELDGVRFESERKVTARRRS